MVNRKSKVKSQKSRIRKGDTVRVLLGKDKGKKAKVMAVLPKEQRVIVEGVNMVKKHIRPKRSGEKGQRVSVASPLHISNVQLVCSACKKGSRVSIKKTEGTRVRLCQQCNEEIA